MVYWVYGIVGGIIMQVLMGVLTGIGGFIGIGLCALLLIPYAIWNGVSLWRCAWNAGAKFWGVIVRILVVLSIPFYIFTIVALFGAATLGGMADVTPTHSTPVETPMMDQPVSGGAVPIAPEAPVVPVSPMTPDGVAPVAAPIAPPASVPAAPVSVAPATAPVAPAAPATVPGVPPAAVPTPTPAAAMDACEQRMHDFAVQNKADPAAYIAQNQAYLTQCRAALAGQPATP